MPSGLVKTTPLNLSDTETGYYCIRSSDIINDSLDFLKTYQVDEDVYQTRNKRYTPQINDIVYSREGGRLGNAARLSTSKRICLGQRIMLFTPNDENMGHYIWAILESEQMKRKIKSMVGGGAAPRVNIKDLKKLFVSNPPLTLQNKFAKIVEKTEALKSRYTTSLGDLENLYGSLSQKAFKGE